MLPKKFVAEVRRVVAIIVGRTLGHTRLTPSELTVMGLVLIGLATWLLISGAFFWAGCLVALASSFDMLDGALARATNQSSRFGAFLDSTLDRYSEALIFLGLLLHYHSAGARITEVTLLYIVIVGSLLTSYTRARAEALGFDCTVGLLERPERIVLVVLGLLTGWMTLTLWVLAVLTHITALQRIYHVWRQARVGSSSKGSLSLPQRSE